MVLQVYEEACIRMICTTYKNGSDMQISRRWNTHTAIRTWNSW